MRSIRMYSLVTASLVAFGAAGCGSFEKDEPETAVRDFLSQALAEGNGQRACDFLTARGQRGVAGAAAATDPDTAATTCRMSLEKSLLVIDDEEAGDLADVKGLDYSSEVNGDQATVRVTGKGVDLRFRLKHDDGLGNLYEPKTPWRIDSGAEALVRAAS